jgi:hypothetical protein
MSIYDKYNWGFFMVNGIDKEMACRILSKAMQMIENDKVVVLAREDVYRMLKEREEASKALEQLKLIFGHAPSVSIDPKLTERLSALLMPA